MPDVERFRTTDRSRRWPVRLSAAALLAAATVVLARSVGPAAALVYAGVVGSVSALVAFAGSLRRQAGTGGGDEPPRRRVLRLLGLGGAAALAPAVSLGAGRSAGAVDEPARGPDGRVRQWGMIIDLRRCDGCQSQGTPPQCTLACIEGHLAPPPMEWIEVYEAELAGGGTRFVPTPCQQCQNPPCVNVCPVTATFSTREGPVLIDQDRCIGCRMCMAACPYDRRFFNWGHAPVPPESVLADYSPEHQVGAPMGTVMKCDFCPDLARAGSLPMCAAACPNHAIYYGDLEEDIATNGREVVSFSGMLQAHDAFRLKEELGTEPRVHYIPGHGELVGRDPDDEGRMPTVWPWAERAEGSVVWGR